MGPRLNHVQSLVGLIRHGKLSCAEAVNESLTTINANTQSGHIFRHLATDQARSEANEMDQRQVARQAMKPLAGLPVAVMESIAVQGQPTTAATRLDVDDLMPSQGPFIGKLRESGVLMIGKAASTEFRLSLHNLDTDLPANPHYPDEPHVAGGASGGAAAAVANNLVSFAVGSDAHGAARVAASLCGVTGFRPSTEFWSREGMFPLSRETDSLALLTRHTSDLAFVTQALGVGMAPNLNSTPLRLGVAAKPFFEDLHADVLQAFSGLFDRLAKKGAVLTPLVIPDFTMLENFVPLVNSAALVRFLGRERAERGLTLADPVTRPILRLGLDADIGEVQKLFEARRILANRINANLAHIDALITPTVLDYAVPTATIGTVEAVEAWQGRTVRNVRFANLFNMAAVSLPIPSPRPIGLQLMATAGNELKLIGVAQALQHAMEL